MQIAVTMCVILLTKTTRSLAKTFKKILITAIWMSCGTTTSRTHKNAIKYRCHLTNSRQSTIVFTSVKCKMKQYNILRCDKVASRSQTK